MVKAPRHFYGEPCSSDDKPKEASIFWFLLAVLPPLVGLAVYTMG